MNKIVVIIPAHNEEKAIGKVVQDIPIWVSEVIVCNNASTDATALVASEAGATVLHEAKKGYGHACLKGMDYIQKERPYTNIVAFMDGDYADYPSELEKLTNPIIAGTQDFVVGSRALGNKEKGAMTPQQIYGNRLAAWLIKKLYGQKITDLGPYRAIEWNALKSLKMKDKTYGWTVEMQVKAIKHKLRYAEVAVDYKKRIGTSKVSGTLKGTILAGYKIILTVFKYAFA